MRVGVPKETWPGETRVAVIPVAVPPLVKAGLDVVVEPGAGSAAGFPDEAYASHGATLVPRTELFRTADIVLQVRAIPADASLLRAGQAVIGCRPAHSAAKERKIASLVLVATPAPTMKTRAGEIVPAAVISIGNMRGSALAARSTPL